MPRYVPDLLPSSWYISSTCALPKVVRWWLALNLTFSMRFLAFIASALVCAGSALALATPTVKNISASPAEAAAAAVGTQIRGVQTPVGLSTEIVQ